MIARCRALAAALAAALAGCTGELPPHGEVVVVVDTDLEAPRFAGRLRVDIFDEGGSWLETREVARPSDRAWPASFSVFSDDDAAEHVALVRLRSFPEGAIRDYRGERWAARPAFVAPAPAKDLAAACSAPTPLRLGEVATVRRGQADLLGAAGACGLSTATAGAAALALEIPARGAYRCAVLGTVPSWSGATPAFEAVALSARTRCDAASTAVACASAPGAPKAGDLPRFEMTLDPGTITLLVTSPTRAARPADVAVGCAAVAAWPAAWDAPPVAPTSPVGRCAEASGLPTLAADASATPATEPEPHSAVDRLVAIRISPGRRRTARVTLRGSCLGAMASLSAACPKVAAVRAEATTCVDGPGTLEPVREAALDDDPGVPERGVVDTWPGSDPCPAADDGEIVCIPGGLFFLGSRDADGFSAARTAPEHRALVSRFRIDRHEVTVARWRAALAAGFDPRGHAPFANEQPLGTSSQDEKRLCSWSAAPRDREELAVTCVDHVGASAFCAFVGGSLPTEARWEYVAAAAGRGYEATYPWGEGAPTCEQAAVARWDNPSTGSTECRFPDFGPTTVGARPLDVSPLGVVGLGGGVSEWVADAWREYDEPAWEGAALRDPACLEEEAPRYVLRGASFRSSSGATFAANRTSLPGGDVSPYVGFRCAYPAEGSP